MSLVRASICLAIFLMLLAVSKVSAQQTHLHEHPVLEAIDKAYQKGQLSTDESVLYKFYAVRSPSKLPANFQTRGGEPVKCGTPVFADYHRKRDQLSQTTIDEIERMTAASQASETYTSPSGNFLIHYETSGNDAVPPDDTSGVNGVPDYVEYVAAAADSSWRYQVQGLGFTDPILQSSQYDVTIRNLGTGFYGQTRALGNTTEIEIHNNFLNGFPPNDHPDGDQIGAIYVTMAHEFKHAIQYANNQWQGSAGSFNWIEMDATLMEEVTYDNVNDYYNYIVDSRSIFLDPASATPGAYWDVSFSIFFNEIFGPDFWVDVWQEEIKSNATMDFLDAIISQTQSRGSSYPDIFAEAHLWHYASGPENAPLNYGFEERLNYPDPTITETINGTQSSLSSEKLIEAHAANYFDITPVGNESNQVLITLTADINEYAAAAIAYFKDGTSDIYIGTNVSNSGKLRLETTWNWKDVEEIGLVAANTSRSAGINLNVATKSYTADLVTLKQNYPNPFNGTTIIEFTLQQDSNVQLRLYDVTGRLVRTIIDGPRTAGTYTPTLSSDRLASGIYFYRLITDKRSKVKKLTLIK
ncbi:MAG: MXAN_6640 family putative metalloprotease [Balneolaceae bacterium]|nr:MXAN_6640 family putative metalloprotease [Balneolaceae bacterium]